MTVSPIKLDPRTNAWLEGLEDSVRESFLYEVWQKVNLDIEAKRRAKEAPSYWEDWAKELFPASFSSPFADHHLDFWEHAESIKPGVKPLAFFAVWGRGGGKTTNAEAAVVRLGAKRTRKFCVYVRSTQDKANESIQNIATLLEKPSVERYYPVLASRKQGKYGNSLGWRIDTLRCGNDFSVIALGLNASVRGIKLDQFRPDLIVFDDIDDRRDSMAAIQKKIDTITSDILPAGSADVAVLGIQNLIHPNSIFSKLVNGEAEFLYDRIISGPYPSVRDLDYEPRPEGGYRVISGTPTWAGQSLSICEMQINEWGISQFLREAQHEVDDPPGGIWDHIEYRHCRPEEVPKLLAGCVWVDPAVTDTDQSDANGIQADGIDTTGIIYRLRSYEQRSSPEKSLVKAILWAIELGFDWVGVETDQGGDTWETVYKVSCETLAKDSSYPHIGTDQQFPKFMQAKAGAGHGSKVHRNSLMLTGYETGRVVHVTNGSHAILEKSLNRFPLTKPFDLADAAYYGWDFLVNKRYRGKPAKSRGYG